MSARILVRLLTGLSTVAVTLRAVGADVIRVPADQPTIQAGLDAASDGDTVLVADGTYTGPENRDLDFGGKAITLRSEGDPDNCTIDCENAGRAVRFHRGETPAAVLEGFTIRNGYADGANGGGVLCESSRPTIRNCRFDHNTATGGSVEFTGYGGAMACWDGSHPLIENCTFSHNSVTGGSVASTGYGGGLACSTGSNPTIENCIFTGNWAIVGTVGATGSGGAMIADASSPTVRDCVFTENISDGTAGYGGHGAGVFLWNGCCATIEKCTISRNMALGAPGTTSGTGGGMFLGDYSHPRIERCTFSDNTASRNGGGMWCGWSSRPTLVNCAFRGNSAGLYGGGMINKLEARPTLIACTFSENAASEYGGGMFNWYGSDPNIVNCAFRYNRAYDGGAMFNNDGCNPTLINCLLNNNLASRFGGGIVSIDHSNPRLIGCTLNDNSAGSGGGSYSWGNSGATITNCILWGDIPDELVDASGSSATVRRSDVQGGWPGAGNIDADPLFFDSTSDDYHLCPGSPCIDSGDNEVVPPDITTDLDESPRFVDDAGMPDIGLGNPPIVDMGAYEFQAETCFGDVDGDDDIDLADLATLLAHFDATGTVYTDGDLDRDGDVDSEDLAGLLAVYRTTCE